jgi:hypothetical protein
MAIILLVLNLNLNLKRVQNSDVLTDQIYLITNALGGGQVSIFVSSNSNRIL